MKIILKVKPLIVQRVNIFFSYSMWTYFCFSVFEHSIWMLNEFDFMKMVFSFYISIKMYKAVGRFMPK